MKYVLGGEIFRTRPEGAVTVGPLTDYLPIISFPGVRVARLFPMNIF